jgi:hypothetical protein
LSWSPPLVDAAQHAGNGDDAVQVMRHEVAAGFLAAVQQCHFGELGLRQRRLVYAVDRGEPGEVGNRFNVENQGGSLNSTPVLIRTSRGSSSLRLFWVRE